MMNILKDPTIKPQTELIAFKDFDNRYKKTLPKTVLKQNILDSQKASFCVIVLGTNDIYTGSEKKDEKVLARRLKQLVKTFLKNPNCRIFITTPIAGSNPGNKENPDGKLLAVKNAVEYFVDHFSDNNKKVELIEGPWTHYKDTNTGEPDFKHVNKYSFDELADIIAEKLQGK
jgi:hypothetical protein